MTAVVLRGDARNLPLPDESVDLIVCSPPYWQLRDYRDGGIPIPGQIGGEATPQEYIANLLDCTREWARVLKPAGSMFVNLADKYSTRADGSAGRTWREDRADALPPVRNTTGFAPRKSLLALPWRYAIACVDDLGLILRRDIVWDKANPLPESVTDRCATRHEYVFHLVKQPRYYAAVDEIREAGTGCGAITWAERKTNGEPMRQGEQRRTFGDGLAPNPLGKPPGSVWKVASQPLSLPDWLGVEHYAAFPADLPRRCILGWSPPGICVECGEGRWPIASGGRNGDGSKPHKATQRVSSFSWAAWKESEPHRIIGYACACTPYTSHPANGGRTRRRSYSASPDEAHPQGTYGRHQAGEYERVGPWREYHFDRWTPPPTRPALVADPFGGTGTTAMVADVLGRTGISVDLSADYCRAAAWRISDPGERARALGVPKPPPVPQGQMDLFGGEVA